MTSAVANPASFRAEAKFQRVCAYCGRSRPFHAHHVTDKAELGKYGLTGNALYNPRNALRLCEDLSGGPATRCHLQFENRRIVITTRMLKDSNIEYAFEVMGVAAYDYLCREYDNGDSDPRIQLQLDQTPTDRLVRMIEREL